MTKLTAVPGYPGLAKHVGLDGATYWYMSVRLRDGRYARRSVGSSKDGIKSPKVAYRIGKALQAELVGKQEPSTATLQDAHENYLRTKEAKQSDTTRDKDRWNLYLAQLGNYPLDALTTADFQELLIELRGKGLSEGYLEKVFGQARTYFSWAVKAGLWQGVNPLGRDSLFQMPTWRSSAKTTRWFTPAEADQLLEQIRLRSETLYRMSLLSLRTGMRSMEIFGLGELEDALDEVNGQLNFIGKTGRREHVYADREVLQMLRSYGRKRGERIFQAKGGKRIIKISKSFQAAVQAAGFGGEKTHKVWFHSWRHTFGSWLAQSGEFSLQEIMEYMRHTDDRMTRHYAKLIPGHRKDRLTLIKERLEAARNRQSVATVHPTTARRRSGGT